VRHLKHRLAVLSILALPALGAPGALALTPPRRAARPLRSACSSSAARKARRASARPSRRGERGCAPHAATHSRRGARRRAARRKPKSAASTNVSAQLAAAASRSQTIAAVLAAPCPDTELMPEAGDLGLVRAAVLCLINRERAQNGIAPLEPNAELEEAAEGHGQELIAEDYFAHISPSGVTPVDRIRTTGYIPSPTDGYVIGENLAWGTYQLATPQAIVAAWIASPEHLANILEAQYTETGIAVVPAVPSSLANGAPGATYAQEFGVIIP